MVTGPAPMVRIMIIRAFCAHSATSSGTSCAPRGGLLRPPKAYTIPATPRRFSLSPWDCCIVLYTLFGFHIMHFHHSTGRNKSSYYRRRHSSRTGRARPAPPVLSLNLIGHLLGGRDARIHCHRASVACLAPHSQEYGKMSRFLQHNVPCLAQPGNWLRSILSSQI